MYYQNTRSPLFYFRIVLLAVLSTVPSAAQSIQRDDSMAHRPRAILIDEFKGANASPIETMEYRLLDMINTERRSHGLRPLIRYSLASTMARKHSQDMAMNNYMGHTDNNGKGVDYRAKKSGVQWNSLGENVAYNNGYADPLERVVLQWMRSPGHRKNILTEDWLETGVGISIASTGSYYFTQVFVKR